MQESTIVRWLDFTVIEFPVSAGACTRGRLNLRWLQKENYDLMIDYDCLDRIIWLKDNKILGFICPTSPTRSQL